MRIPYFRKLAIILLTLGLIPLKNLAQNNYILIDSFATVNVDLMDMGSYSNAKYCIEKKGDQEIRYTPYQAKGYGFSDGRIYVSKVIQSNNDTSKRVFLELLAKGKANVYFYKGKGHKTFYVEKDTGSLIEIPKRGGNINNSGYKSQLSQLTADCKPISDAIKLAAYNKKSMRILFESYNNCEYATSPTAKFGINAGYKFSKLIPSSKVDYNLKHIAFSYKGGFTIGLFLHKPLPVKNLSIFTELYYTKLAYSYNSTLDNNDIDFVANISSLNLPLLLRYTYPSKKIRPFINAGALIGFNFKNENEIYLAYIDPNRIELVDLKHTSQVHKNQVGYSMGCGIEYKLNYRNSLFFEVRYSKLFGVSEIGTLNNSEIHFITGINI